MKSTISQKAGFLAPAVLSTGFLPSEGAASAIAGHTERSTPIAAPASRGTAKNIGLFLAAPFIGLAYLVALPFVAIAMLAWVVGKALAASPTARKVGRFVRNAALFLAAPFIGLAYLVALPFAGLVMLARLSARAALATPATA
jgi:hypothetical protein